MKPGFVFTNNSLEHSLSYPPDFSILTFHSIDTHFDASTPDSFENIVGKGEIGRNEQFLLFRQCFQLN